MTFSLKTLMILITLCACYFYFLTGTTKLTGGYSLLVDLWMIPICVWLWLLTLKREVPILIGVGFAGGILFVFPVLWILLLFLTVYCDAFRFAIWISLYILVHGMGLGAGIGALFVQGKRGWGVASILFFIVSFYIFISLSD